ncbi:antiviral reverse transcriptase Drt3b [Lonsdalea quercina]|uniref:antiviral reverse transcriptase Drt3b n=1 Tax=Lonsdalea quercina TaxID=71657 RepID=UPI003976E2A1
MKIEIEKKDYNRVLLTDTLPYELPILCSNEGIYTYFNKADDIPTEFKHIFNKSQTTIPFNYKIKKDSTSLRTLSIPHISNQIRSCEFYEKYEHILLHMCSRSPISLRFPNKVGNYFYEKDFLKNRINLRDGEVNVINNGFDEQSMTSSSHFSYKKYNFVYKFYDSFEFHRLERKYKLLMKLDISKFFNHIYTHSMCWAVKSKTYSKKHREYNHFEGALDKLFQDSNYGETNGIIIGPEFSRIFSEIILQKIDCNLVNKLENTFQKLNESDYSIRRYVDDYFVFSNDKETLNEIEIILSSELEDYKLYLNESKKIIIERPFITGSTMAKEEIKTIIDEIYDSIVDGDKIKRLESIVKGRKEINVLNDDDDTLFPLKIIWNKKYEANKYIKRMKLTIKKNNISFEQLSSYLLSAIKSKFFNVIRKLSLFKIENKKTESYRFFSVFFELIFFIYSMDSRVRQTYIISQIILEVVSFTKNQDEELQEVTKKNLFDEVMICMKNFGKIKDRQVEVSNLLICLNSLGIEYKLNQITLHSLLKDDLEKKLNLDYFVIVATIFYIKKDNSYNGLRKEIINRIKEKFVESPDLGKDTEAELLIMDFLCCPYIDDKEKKDLFRTYIKHSKIENLRNNHSNEEINTILNHFNNKTFFFNWNGEANLEEFLYRKELRTPYE